MLRKLLSTLSIVVATTGWMLAQNESAIKVKLTDKNNHETIPFANVIVEMGGIQAGVGITNIDGEAMIKPLNPGKYDVKASYVGYQTAAIGNVSIAVGKTVYLNIEMTAGQELKVVEITEWKEPLIDPDTKSGGTVTREEYENMASKNINSVAATTAGVYQRDEGGSLNMRGARDNATAYYVDGQKVIGSAGVPQESVEQITTIVGGTPAEYGDETGGIVSITTRGPASKYTGSVQLISSGIEEKKGLDAYGYNYIGFSINGPILSRQDSASSSKKSVLGFSISGEAVTQKDPNPSAGGFYKINSDKLAQIENTPLKPSATGGLIPTAEFITKDDMTAVKAKTNVGSNSLLMNGKMIYQPTANMGITIGGSVDYNKRHDFIYEYALFNPSNNPQTIASTWRAYGKLTQKFNNASAKEEEKSASIIKNAYFTLQASYALDHSKTWDDTHKDNIFNYGYIGKFVQTMLPSIQNKPARIYLRDNNGNIYLDTVTGNIMNSYQSVNLAFTPSDVNPNGVAYTNEYYANALNQGLSTQSSSDVQGGLGLMNGDRPSNVYSLWFNTGRQYNGYGYTNNSQFRVFANFSADIKKHAISMGFEYEQRTERSYTLNPIGLWTLMRQLANFQLKNLDSVATFQSNVMMVEGSQSFVGDGYFYQRHNDGTQNAFDRNFRTSLGLDPNGIDYIDIDSYDPSKFSIDMFSPDDLLRSGVQYVSYYGYDHTGKKLTGKPSLDDFFTAKDENGNYTRQIGAFQPIYIAGYIQDKFDFKDLKFNIGLRVDRYDANQKVLKDKYLLYEAKTAGEVTSIGGNSVSHPSNIGDDFVVYVDNKDNPSRIVGYRSGDTWYNAQGTAITDASSLTGTNTVDGAINPYLVDPASVRKKIITGKVFEDYKPQLNLMPRIAFSFPISDVASFTAHYDILTQRPPGFNRLDPVQYLNIENNAAGFINNPNLKPEKTTDYELGFQEVLNEKKNSVIKISAFYRELRNMVQTVQVFQAFPTTYNTFDNIDFGTVKGLSLSYELRRMATGVQLTAGYTLQFADGTGSSTSDGANLTAAGEPNLRVPHALDFDQRHTVVLNVDYRFGGGKDYKGPTYTRKKGDSEKTFKLLENMGANITLRAGSGTPYSKQSNITQDGSFGVAERHILKGKINGSNLPWNFKIDLRVDKDLELTWGGKKEGQEKKKAMLNIYLQVLNVLNTKNVYGVYHATGNPDDDGYLASVAGQTAIAGSYSPQSFTDLYNIKINNPANYSQPRVIRLGLELNF